MLWYAMVWYDECDSMRLYAMVWDSNAMLWDFNAMLWDFNAMLCYGVCCKRYAWTDCIAPESFEHSIKNTNNFWINNHRYIGPLGIEASTLSHENDIKVKGQGQAIKSCKLNRLTLFLMK